MALRRGDCKDIACPREPDGRHDVCPESAGDGRLEEVGTSPYTQESAAAEVALAQFPASPPVATGKRSIHDRSSLIPASSANEEASGGICPRPRSDIRCSRIDRSGAPGAISSGSVIPNLSWSGWTSTILARRRGVMN